jgi:hypothetical protein
MHANMSRPPVAVHKKSRSMTRRRKKIAYKTLQAEREGQAQALNAALVSKEKMRSWKNFWRREAGSCLSLVKRGEAQMDRYLGPPKCMNTRYLKAIQRAKVDFGNSTTTLL